MEIHTCVCQGLGTSNVSWPQDTPVHRHKPGATGNGTIYTCLSNPDDRWPQDIPIYEWWPKATLIGNIYIHSLWPRDIK